MISTNKLTFSYGEAKVLSDIDLKLEKGRIYGLLGENGVGKTTLLSLLSGLKKPCAGSIEVDSQVPFKRDPSFLSSIFYLQDEMAPVAMTPESFASARGRFWTDFSMDKFKAVMEEFSAPLDLKMNRMSFGQLKKTYIAFALATGARYLFMDEPTNGLDIPSKAQFRSALMKHTSEESTLVISTHQVRDLENVIDPVIILDRDGVILNATLEEISVKLLFDYGAEQHPEALYCEMLPGTSVQVLTNRTGADSKVSLEALFNAVLSHKEYIKSLFA